MSQLSHLNARGEANMVDVADKDVTRRTARAEGFLAMAPATLALIETGTAKKGDVIATARIAGIMAAKRTHELIPLCHQLSLSKVQLDFEMQSEPAGVWVRSEVRLDGKTGVEMEALTAISVACLTLYDMLKAADKSMRIEAVQVVEKAGGRSGHYIADGAIAATGTTAGGAPRESQRAQNEIDAAHAGHQDQPGPRS